MLTVGTNFFLSNPAEPEQVIHAALLIDGNLTAQLRDTTLSRSPSDDILVHYDLQGRFVQQPTVVEMAMGRSRLLVTFRTQGEPIRA